MKRILFATIVILVLITNKSYSQTFIETFRWINATFLEMTVDIKNQNIYMSYELYAVYRDTTTKEITAFEINWTYRNGKENSFLSVTIPFKNIVIYETKQYDDVVYIAFAPRIGKFKGIRKNVKNDFEFIEYKKEYPFYMGFLNTPENVEKVKKLVKAFHHLVELTGNDVYNKDIFPMKIKRIWE